jgi:nucleotide-binding universal stress UspA family protein
VHHGLKISKAIGSELFVAHIDVDILNQEGGNIATSRKDLQEEYNQEKQKIKAELDRLIASEQDSSNPVIVKDTIVSNKLYADVIRLVKDNDIDLLIMMAHPEGHIEIALFDQDNAKIIRDLPCSIFLVKE